MAKARQHPVLHVHLAQKKKLTVFDKFITIAAFAYPLSGLPQVYDVLQGNIAGVSLVSWTSFVVFSALFLTYGLMHKVTPMIITNGLWVVVNSLVVIGTIAHGALG